MPRHCAARQSRTVTRLGDFVPWPLEPPCGSLHLSDEINDGVTLKTKMSVIHLSRKFSTIDLIRFGIEIKLGFS